jgi:hypothetical protein
MTIRWFIPCVAFALVACSHQPAPQPWEAFYHKPEFDVDSDRCRTIAKSTQSAPEEIRAMYSLALPNPEAGLEEGRYSKCMSATGKYPFLDMPRPDPARVQGLRDAADAQARIEVMQEGKTVDRITPESVGYADQTAQMCGIPTNALQSALRRHPSFDPDGMGVARGRSMAKSSQFSINKCTNIGQVITRLTAAFNTLSGK